MGGPAAVADALTHHSGAPTAHGRWEPLHGGQGSISLEYQTCTSPYPFDTLVTGLGIATPPQLALPEDFSLLVTQVFYLCLLFKLLNKPVFLRLGREKRGPKGFQLEAPKLPVYISKGHSSQVL